MLNTIHKVTGVKIKPNDSKRLLYICIVLFLLLTSNGILSPIRDTLGSMQGKDVVSYLVSMSTFTMIVINPLTSYIANNCTTLIMGKIYIRGACITCLLFFLIFRFQPTFDNITMSIFFIWANLHSVLSVSVVWGVSGDILDLKESRSYFALLSLAGTAGHICGAGLTSFLTRRNVNVKYILLIPIVLLEICYEIYIYVLNMKQDEENENNLSSSQQQSSQQKDKKGVNKKGTNKKNEDNSLASNFCSACSSLYTLFIILYTTCYSVGLTMLYLEKISILSHLNTNEKALAFANMNFFGSITTIVIQIFLAGRMLSKSSTSISLLLLPLSFSFGFFCIFQWNDDGNAMKSLYMFEILRRAVAYGFVKPVRELLYQALDKSQKYNTKAFNDSIARKVGDMFAPLYSVLTSEWRMLNVTCVCTLWCWLAVYLGITFDKKMVSTSSSGRSSSKKKVRAKTPAKKKATPAKKKKATPAKKKKATPKSKGRTASRRRRSSRR